MEQGAQVESVVLFWGRRRELSEGDPTDHALATIASILEEPEGNREVEKSATEAKPAAAASMDDDGYSKVGPGPIAAIRFKWTARRAADGEYFVDETIGDNASAIVSGPMTREAAIQLVDQREYEEHQRFEQLRLEMTGRAAAADLVRRGVGEA